MSLFCFQKCVFNHHVENMNLFFGNIKWWRPRQRYPDVLSWVHIILTIRHHSYTGKRKEHERQSTTIQQNTKLMNFITMRKIILNNFRCHSNPSSYIHKYFSIRVNLRLGFNIIIVFEYSRYFILWKTIIL